MLPEVRMAWIVEALGPRTVELCGGGGGVGDIGAAISTAVGQVPGSSQGALLEVRRTDVEVPERIRALGLKPDRRRLARHMLVVVAQAAYVAIEGGRDQPTCGEFLEPLAPARLFDELVLAHVIDDGDVVAAGAVSEGTGDPTFADAVGPVTLRALLIQSGARRWRR
jgi:hypothetical protein